MSRGSGAGSASSSDDSNCADGLVAIKTGVDESGNAGGREGRKPARAGQAIIW
jgi:hypothetical protein